MIVCASPDRSDKRSASTISRSSYRVEVDGLRAIAVCAVVVYHFNGDALPGGYLGVDMFFVISGYVITSSLAQQTSAEFTTFLLNFYSRRVKRLLPALIACVVCTAALGALFIEHDTAEYQSSLKSGAASLIGVSNLYFLSIAADYFGPLSRLNLFTQTWSLGVEEQFYLVFPTLYWLSVVGPNATIARRCFLALLIALGAASLLSFCLTTRADPEVAYYLMPTRFWELGVGCATFAILKPASVWLQRPSQLAWIAALLIALGLGSSSNMQVVATIAVVFATALLIAALRPGDFLYRALTSSPIIAIGRMSYSIYLWHWSVIALSRWTVGTPWFLAPIQLALIFGLSAFSYRFVETPLRYAKWSRRPLSTIGLGAGCAMGALAIVVAFYEPISKPLYLGQRAKLIARGPESTMEDRYDNGKRIWLAKQCLLTSNAEVGMRIDAGSCTVAARGDATRRFLVVGNSYSAAEFEMYTVLTENNVGSVTVTSSFGASPIGGLINRTKWSAASAYYWSDVVPSLVNGLVRGDVVVMISDLQELSPATPDAASELALQQFKENLAKFTSALSARGVGVAFQAANPFIRDAQCGPDSAQSQWFHLAGYSSCRYYSKEYSLRRREKLQAALVDIQRENDNFLILDLFSVMCPEADCRFDDGKGTILYRDGFSHSSVEANHLARPTFLATIDALTRQLNRQTIATGSAGPDVSK